LEKREGSLKSRLTEGGRPCTGGGLVLLAQPQRIRGKMQNATKGKKGIHQRVWQATKKEGGVKPRTRLTGPCRLALNGEVPIFRRGAVLKEGFNILAREKPFRT